MARRYRDAILEAFPPYTTLELAQWRKRDNLSGVAGVQHIYLGGKHIGWLATMVDRGVRRTKSFSFTQYGEDAFDEAVKQRLAWLGEKDDRFFTRDSESRVQANKLFSELLGTISIDDGTMAGFRARLRSVNEAFDAMFPDYVHVSVHVGKRAGKPILRGRVYSSAISRRHIPIVSIENRSLPDALDRLQSRVVEILILECGGATAAAFVEEHNKSLRGSAFDPEKGFFGRTLIHPKDALATSPE